MKFYTMDGCSVLFDVLLIQETSLLPHEIRVFTKYFIGYNCCGVSGMNSEVLYNERPFGGCSVLYIFLI